MPLKSAPLYGNSRHRRPSISAMRCISATSKPAGFFLVVKNSNGGSGSAAPTFRTAAAPAVRAPCAPAAYSGNAASKLRRVVGPPNRCVDKPMRHGVGRRPQVAGAAS